jgi:hypothetical protein
MEALIPPWNILPLTVPIKSIITFFARDVDNPKELHYLAT